MQNPLIIFVSYVIYFGILFFILYWISKYVFRIADNAVIKNKYEEVRLIWKILFLIIFIFVFDGSTAYIVSIIYYGSVKETFLLSSVETLKGAAPGWELVIASAIYVLSCFLAVWFMVAKLEKRPYPAKEIGWDWRRNTIYQVGLGILLGLLYAGVVYLCVVVISSIKILGYIYILKPSFSTLKSGTIQLMPAVQLILSLVTRAFAEEVCFRSYLQSRMVERAGVWKGILVTSVIFSLIHVTSIPQDSLYLFIPLNIVAWWFFGYLFHKTRSLYLVSTIHASFNIIWHFVFVMK
jgi:membrane protease YdiL (CAAX protease family)